MGMIKIYVFIQIILIIFNTIKSQQKNSKDRELIFVYEHVRHGARGPSSSYDSIFEDGYDEYNVKWDFDGELSSIGKRQHYYLGVRNRLKYGHFMDFNEYNPMEILIHATDYNRTHQSINAELYGMYGNCQEKELEGEEKDYKLINRKYLQKSNLTLYNEIENVMESIGNKVTNHSFPIFNIHKFPDKRIFLVDDCHKIDQYRDENLRDKVEELYAKFNERYADKLVNLKRIKREYFTNYNKMKSIADHFICDYDNKKDLSDVRNLDIDLDEFYQFARDFYGRFIFDWFVDGFTSGLEETHLMQDVLGYMSRRIEHYKKNGNTVSYKAPKMVMDCGHDTTVGPIARFLDSVFHCDYHDFCDFACNVFFELYREIDENGNEKFTVDYYLDDELKFSGKEFSLEFKAEMEKKFWNDTYANEFCGEKETFIQKEDGIEKYSVILFGATFISTSLLIIFATSTFIFYRRFKKLQKRLKENPLLDQEMEGSELPELS